MRADGWLICVVLVACTVWLTTVLKILINQLDITNKSLAGLSEQAAFANERLSRIDQKVNSLEESARRNIR
jgi:uncharacterized protein YoxC